MEITKLEPGRTVHWIIQRGVPEWIGNTVTWDQLEDGDTTTVCFAQRGDAPADRLFAQTTFTWA